MKRTHCTGFRKALRSVGRRAHVLSLRGIPKCVQNAHACHRRCGFTGATDPHRRLAGQQEFVSTALSIHADHQGRPITPHTSSDSRPSSLPIRPSSSTARATASSRKGVGRNPRHPPVVPRQWPNNGGWLRRPHRRRRRRRHRVHDDPCHRRRRARCRVDERAADGGHGSVGLCLHACGGGDGRGHVRNGSRNERTRGDDGDPGRWRRCRRSGGRRGPNRSRRHHRRLHRGRRLRPAGPRAAGQHLPLQRGRLGLLPSSTGARCPSPHRRRAHIRRPQAAPDGVAAAQQRPLQAPLRPPAAVAAGTATPSRPKRRGPPGDGAHDSAPARRAGGPPHQPTRRRPPPQPPAGDAVVAAAVVAAPDPPVLLRTVHPLPQRLLDSPLPAVYKPREPKLPLKPPPLPPPPPTPPPRLPE